MDIIHSSLNDLLRADLPPDPLDSFFILKINDESREIICINFQYGFYF